MHPLRRLARSRKARLKYAKISVGGFQFPDPEETAALSKAGKAGRNVYHEDYSLINKIHPGNPGRFAGTMAAVSSNTPFPREVENAVGTYGRVLQHEAEELGGYPVNSVYSRPRLRALLTELKRTGRIPNTVMSTQVPNVARALHHHNPGVHGENVLSGAKVDEYRQARVLRGSQFPLDTHELTILGLKDVPGLAKHIEGQDIPSPVGERDRRGRVKKIKSSGALHHAVREFGGHVTDILNAAGPHPGTWDSLKTQAAQWAFLRAVIDAAAQPGANQFNLEKALQSVTHENIANGVSLGSVVFEPGPNGEPSSAYRMMEKVGLGHLLPEMRQMYEGRREERGGSKEPVVASLSREDVQHIRAFLKRMEPQILASARTRGILTSPHPRLQKKGERLRYAQVVQPTPQPAPQGPSPVTSGQPMPTGPNMAAPQKSPEDEHREHLLSYSPNQEEGLTFEDALARVRSGNQKAFKQIIKHVTEQVGIKPQLQDAVGDWSDGAENSILQSIKDPIGPETAEYLAAWYGLLGNQKAVLSFTPSYNGADSVYQIELPQTDMKALRAQLDKSGIPFRTLVPSNKGTKVVIYDQGRELRDKVAQFAGVHNAPIRESVGQGRFIGGDTRTAARAAYRKIITKYESTKTANGGSLPTYRPPVEPHHLRESRPAPEGKLRQARTGSPLRYSKGLDETLNTSELRDRPLPPTGEHQPLRPGFEAPHQMLDRLQQQNENRLTTVPPVGQDEDTDRVEAQAGAQNEQDLELSQKHGEHIGTMAKKILESGSRGAWLTLHHLGLGGYAKELMARHKGRVKMARPKKGKYDPTPENIKAELSFRDVPANALRNIARKHAKDRVVPQLVKSILRGDLAAFPALLDRLIELGDEDSRKGYTGAMGKPITWEDEIGSLKGLRLVPDPSAEDAPQTAGQMPESQKQVQSRVAKMRSALNPELLGKPDFEPPVKFARRGGVKAPAQGVIVRGMFYPGGKFIPSANLEKAKYDQYRHVEEQRARYARGDVSAALTAEALRKEQ